MSEARQDWAHHLFLAVPLCPLQELFSSSSLWSFLKFLVIVVISPSSLSWYDNDVDEKQDDYDHGNDDDDDDDERGVMMVMSLISIMSDEQDGDDHDGQEGQDRIMFCLHSCCAVATIRNFFLHWWWENTGFDWWCTISGFSISLALTFCKLLYATLVFSLARYKTFFGKMAQSLKLYILRSLQKGVYSFLYPSILLRTIVFAWLLCAFLLCIPQA